LNQITRVYYYSLNKVRSHCLSQSTLNFIQFNFETFHLTDSLKVLNKLKVVGTCEWENERLLFTDWWELFWLLDVSSVNKFVLLRLERGNFGALSKFLILEGEHFAWLNNLDSEKSVLNLNCPSSLTNEDCPVYFAVFCLKIRSNHQSGKSFVDILVGSLYVTCLFSLM